MTPEQFQRVSDLFERACALEAEAATALVDREAADDPLVRDRVRSMLAADGRAGGALDTPALGAGFHVAHAAAEPLPDRIGRYRVIRLIGEGGMGRVYEAEQDAPRRRVALKVLRGGMMSRQMLRRFADESELLGRLDHPGIGKVYEAGTFELGGSTLPFFAMEFVEGEALTSYVRRHALDVHTRVDLLARIADAAHHAHQRGVVHRDLKPDNILVDATGRARILDFGVARSIDEDARATMRTEAGQIIGTLAYMSPEQLAGRGEVDSRADVYALGVIAYEVLAGCRPHDLDDESLPSAIRRLADERAPRLGTIDRHLRGDIETIVARAMEPEPDRRYASASELAGDLRRFLAREPILARPPSAIYQVRTFARRNRALTAGAGATVLALVVGIVGIALALREARAETARAQEQQAIAEAVNEFLNDDLLAAVAPGEQGIDVRMREVLDTAAERIEGRFDDQPVVEVAIRGTLGRTYLRLGELELAVPHMERAVELCKAHYPADARETFKALNDLANVYKRLGRYDDAEPLYLAALEGRRRVLGPEHVGTLEIMNNLGASYEESGRLDEAEPLYVDALAIARRTLGEDDIRTGDLMNNLAVLYGRLRRNEEALPPGHWYGLYFAETEGRALVAVGRFDDAEAVLLETLRQAMADFDAGHALVRRLRADLVELYEAMGEPERAEPYRDAETG